MLTNSSFLVAPKTESELFWEEQEASLKQLLRSRVLLRTILQKRMYEERVKAGNLTAFEVCQLLESQGEDDDTDFVAQITEMKRTLMAETRTMREQERQIEEMDRRISLLVKNAGQVTAMQHRPPRTKQKQGEDTQAKMTEPITTLYSNLFYALQTAPSYLAKIVEVLEDRYNPPLIAQMVETILLTLFGDAFSPREEALLLQVFRITIESSFARCKKLTDFVERKTIAPMVMTYAKRKQGIECVQSTLGSLISDVIQSKKSFEVNAKRIHDKIITIKEIETGEKMMANRHFGEKMILEVPEVKEVLNKNREALRKSCNDFFEAIVNNVKRVPYGLRWICKQIDDCARKTFPKASDEDIGRSVGHYIYFRFYSVAICSPAAFRITASDIPAEAQLNLLAVSKVLYQLFNGQPFKVEKDKWMSPLNEWLEPLIPRVRQYFKELIDVEEPETFLEVDAYLDLIQAVKPVILISFGEIFRTHEVIYDNIDDIAGTDKKDELHIIMNELDKPVKYGDENRDINLTLINKFPKTPTESADEATQLLYNQTKALTIRTLRMIPSSHVEKSEDVTFAALLKIGLKFSKESDNLQLKTNLQTIKANLQKLEASSLVDKKDGYRSFMKKIALEIANRQQVLEQQRSELKRLSTHIDTVRKKQVDQTQLIDTMDKYIETCKKQQFSLKTKKKKKSNVAQVKPIGPFKFSYTELVKQRIIAVSDVPKLFYKATKFNIRSNEPGVFIIEVNVSGIDSLKVDPFEIELDELLDKQALNIERISKTIRLGQEEIDVELDVNMTLHLFNKLLAKK